jgi:TolB protein
VSASPGASNSETDPEICSINADGTGVRRLTNTPEYEGVPAWSPDGKKIAFVSYDKKVPHVNPGGVYVMNADGSGRTKLPWPEGSMPKFATGGSRDLAWSPDGKKIAFQGNRNIYVVAADGSSKPRRLTTGPHWETASSPTWSPDGKQIAYSAGLIPGAANSHTAIFEMNSDGSNPRTVTDVATQQASGPSWQP